LEVGVGGGQFLVSAKKAGFTVEGCDISKGICEHMQNTYGIHMFMGELGSVPQTGYDVIVMNHVLEHVEKPLSMLRDAYERLRTGGLLHIAVPNVACLEARFASWNSYERYHLCYFTPKTLEKLVLKAGFEVVFRTTHESFSAWFLVLLRGLLMKRKPQPYTGYWQAGPHRSEKEGIRCEVAEVLAKSRGHWLENTYRIITLTFGMLIWPIRKAQGAYEKGDELITIARKP
jgi:SAM-dependent methyltransferase